MFVSGADWFLPSTLDRRTLLKGASSAALGLIASACASSSQAAPRSAGSPAGSGGKASETGSAPAQSATVADGAEDRQTVYVFNVGSKDVTLIDVANRQVRETRPLGASVRWLSNEQTYWDGARIWTYDFPNDQVQAIAIEPEAREPLDRWIVLPKEPARPAGRPWPRPSPASRRGGPFHRSVRKNLRTSSLNSAGCSKAAK